MYFSAELLLVGTFSLLVQRFY